MDGINQKKTNDWINTPIPALDELTPMECTKSDMLTTRLRTVLMRMPK